MPSLLERIKERKIGQWGLAYLAAAFVVIQVMDPVAEPLGLSLAVQRAILFLLPVGFLIVLVVAWYHGERGRQSVFGTELVLVTALVGAGVLGVAVIVTAPAERSVPDTDGAQDALTLAVLPLQNLSADPDNGLFSEGLTAQIHSELSRIGQLRVAARTSTVRYRESDVGVREIGAELGVRFLLGGGVFRDGDRIRIDVQLSDATSGFDVWSETFPGDIADLLTLQEETAVEIAKALGVELTAADAEAVRRRYTENVEAYDSYLRGWALLESFHSRFDVPEERLEAARGHFEHAIASDDDYALAIAGLSMIEGYYVFFGVDDSPARVQSAIDLAEAALSIDPSLPEGHAALGDAHLVAGEFSSAIENFEEALRSDPENVVVLCHLAYACLEDDPPDVIVAEQSALEAVRIHPTYFWSYWQLGKALQAQEREQGAIEAFEQTIDLNPDFPNTYRALGDLYVGRGQFADALAVYERAIRALPGPGWIAERAFVYAEQGDVEAALGNLGEALAAGFDDFDLVETMLEGTSLANAPRLLALLDRYR